MSYINRQKMLQIGHCLYRDSKCHTLIDKKCYKLDTVFAVKKMSFRIPYKRQNVVTKTHTPRNHARSHAYGFCTFFHGHGTGWIVQNQ